MNNELYDEFHRILNNPQCFPVEITFVSGDKLVVRHPDEVHMVRPSGRIIFYPKEGDSLFEWLPLDCVAKVRAKAKKDWLRYFRTGSKE